MEQFLNPLSAKPIDTLTPSRSISRLSRGDQPAGSSIVLSSTLLVYRCSSIHHLTVIFMASYLGGQSECEGSTEKQSSPAFSASLPGAFRSAWWIGCCSAVSISFLVHPWSAGSSGSPPSVV